MHSAPGLDLFLCIGSHNPEIRGQPRFYDVYAILGVVLNEECFYHRESRLELDIFVLRFAPWTKEVASLTNQYEEAILELCQNVTKAQ